MKKQPDILLKKWAETHSPSADRLEKLADRISAKLPYASINAAGNACRAPRRLLILARLAYTTLGAAIALTVLLYLPQNRKTTTSDEPPPSAESAADLAGISCKRIAGGIRLFEEMDRLFNGNLRWVAESNGNVGIGVETMSANNNGIPAMVRITVLSRKDGENDWTTSWESDMLLRGEDLIEVTPNADSDDHLALWVFPLEDGKIAVDTSVSLDLSAELTATVSRVINSRETVVLATSHINNTQFRILQTVVLLDNAARTENKSGNCRKDG